MQVSVENVNTIERRITIGVPAELIENEVDQRLRSTATTANMPGFRPGKVPLSMVKKRYGAGVRDEVVSKVMRESFYDAITQEKLNPVGAPKIEPKTMEPGKDLEYTATFEIYPEITLADLSKLSVERTTATIEGGDIDKMIEQLREQQAKPVEVDRAAQDGDKLVVDFVGTLEGEAFEGGSATDFNLELGSKGMIPGFEEGVIGASAGEEKIVKVTFPEDYQAENLAGKDAEFTVTVKQVCEPTLPELDETFFTAYGLENGDEAGFRAQVERNMQRELDKAIRAKVKDQVVLALLDAHDIEVPNALMDQEVERMRAEMVQQFGGGAQIDPSALPADLFKPQAKKRVSTGLIINQYIQDKGIALDNDRLRKLVEETAESYEDPEQVVNYIMSDEQQITQFRAITLEEQVVDQLLDLCKVTEVASSYEEALKPVQPAAEPEEDADAQEAQATEKAEEKPKRKKAAPKSKAKKAEEASE